MINQESRSGRCDFSPFMRQGRVRLHRREKAVFYVTKELQRVAREAADILSDHIGIDLFEIRDIYDPGNGSEIYIATDKAHYEDVRRAHKEPDSYLAYCTREDYNRETGEIYESDIVFNPILYDRERELLKKDERKTRRAVRDAEDIIEDKKEKDLAYCDRFTNQEACYEDVENHYEKYERRLERFEDEADDHYSDWEKDIEKITLLTMIHELGHSLGYDHTPYDTENIMHNGLNRDNFNNGILTGRQVNAVLCAFSLRRSYY